MVDAGNKSSKYSPYRRTRHCNTGCVRRDHRVLGSNIIPSVLETLVMASHESRKQQRNSPDNHHPTSTVADSFQKALQMMKDAGYAVEDHVRVVVDPSLGFMGYTFPKDGHFTIVVSGAAVDSGMLEGLLVHEMSHVYRMKTMHPSHNEQIINEAIGRFEGTGLNRDYKQKILHDLVNHLEDLYADDLAFKVFENSNIFPVEEVGRFFLSWLSTEPVVSGNAKRDRWVNMAMMLRNSFALTNMYRHRIPDIEKRARRMNEKLLSAIPADMSKSFEYFQKVMASLREDVTQSEFRTLLGDYLERFVILAEGQRRTN